jgi:predicted DsbA family dithiol-disulfide isomerase
MGIVDKLKQEFDLNVEWLGFEIHPETPREGMLLTTLFPHADVDSLTQNLQTMGAPFGLSFEKIVMISNSHLSLEASEFAKEHNRFELFHRLLFETYFTQRKDIGNLEILTLVGNQAGLDAGALRDALQRGTYRQAIENVRQEAARLGVTAAPTFIINDQDRIVGAQPLARFRDILRHHKNGS